MNYPWGQSVTMQGHWARAPYLVIDEPTRLIDNVQGIHGRHGAVLPRRAWSVKSCCSWRDQLQQLLPGLAGPGLESSNSLRAATTSGGQIAPQPVELARVQVMAG